MLVPRRRRSESATARFGLHAGDLRAVAQDEDKLSAGIAQRMRGKEGSRGATTSPTKSMLIENGDKSVHTDRIHVDEQRERAGACSTRRRAEGSQRR